MLGHRRILPAALALSAAVVAACGSNSQPAASPPPTADALSGANLTVFAAASLTAAFDDAKTRLEATHNGLTVTYSFAGSQALVTQVENGAPADVIATADTSTMQALITAGLVDAPQTFVHNKLEIAVAPGNPKHIAGLSDLGRTDLKVVLADASVPAGKYGRKALQAQGITVNPVSQPLDVKSALLTVEQGNADAAIVYVTDVTAAGSAVSGVVIPDAENILATYPIAVVKASQHAAAARVFVALAVSGAIQQALLARGFLAP